MLVASTAFAQGAAGQGTPGTGSPRGTAPSGPPAFDESNTSGWGSMSAAERSAHPQRMQSFKSHNECNTYMAEKMRSRPGPGTTSPRERAPSAATARTRPRR